MDPQRIKKIEDLIIQSKILNPQERAEWLALLDLMNDKQLTELERILLGAKELRVTGDKSRFAVAPLSAKPLSQTLGTTPAMLKEKIAAMPAGLPKLSHIMNLPKLEQLGSKPIKGLRITDYGLGSKNQSKGGFGEKLKSLIAEKELPEGEVELEMPKGDTTDGFDHLDKLGDDVRLTAGRTNRTDTTYTTGITRLNYGALPPVPRPKPKQESFFAKASEDKLGSRNYELGIKSQAKPDAPKPVPPPVPEIQTLVNKILAPKPPPPVAAQVAPLIKGLSKLPDKVFAKPAVSLSAVLKPREAIGNRLAESRTRPLPEAQVKTKVQATFASPADLTEISEQSLQGGWDLLAKKISVLIAQYGYHEVQQNLEKSPLYISYLKTGMAALKDQVSFERLNDPPQPGFLDRNKFEQTADLLRAIQAG